MEMRKGARDEQASALRRLCPEDEGGEPERVEHNATEKKRGCQKSNLGHQTYRGSLATSVCLMLRVRLTSVIFNLWP